MSTYTPLLRTAITDALDLQHRLHPGSSRSQLTMVLRITQDYLRTTNLAFDVDPTYHLNVIAGKLRQTIGRHEQHDFNPERVLAATRSTVALIQAIRAIDPSNRAMTDLLAAWEVAMLEGIAQRKATPAASNKPNPDSPSATQNPHEEESLRPA